MAIVTYTTATIYHPILEVFCQAALSATAEWVASGWIVIDPGGGVVPDNPLDDLFDRVAAIEALGPLATDVELGAHAANLGAHGVTRELITFTAATPVHISGNLLSHDRQRGIGFVPETSGVTMTAVAGGADDGGASRWVLSNVSSYQHNSTTVLTGAVSPGQQVTASFRAQLIAGTGSKQIGAEGTFRDSSGNVLGSNITMTMTTLDRSTRTYSFTTPAAPAGAVTFRWIIFFHQAYGIAIGDTIDLSVFCLRTSPTIPSSSGVAGVLADGSAAVRLEGTDLVVSCSGDQGTAFMHIPGTGFARVNLEMLASAGSELWVYSPKPAGGYVYDWKNVSDNVWRSFGFAGDVFGAGIYWPTSVNGSWFRLRDMRVERSIYS